MNAGVLEEVMDLLRQRTHTDRNEMEQLVKELEISEESIECDADGTGCCASRKLIARNETLDCVLCEWPSGSNNFFATKDSNFEVIRILSGKLTLIERHEIQGKMEPYCTTELTSGSVISLPHNLHYSLQNTQKEAARTLHIVCPCAGKAKS